MSWLTHTFKSPTGKGSGWDVGSWFFGRTQPGDPPPPEQVDQKTGLPVNLSAPTRVLMRGRDYSRGLYANYGNSLLDENARATGRNIAGVDQGLAKRGLYSSSLSDAMRLRAQESGARTRGVLQDQITSAKANADAPWTRDIAGQLSHEQDVKANYVGQAANANAQRSAQDSSNNYAALAAMAAMFA